MKVGERVKRVEGTIIAESDDYFFVQWDDYNTPIVYGKKSGKLIPVLGEKYYPSKPSLGFG